MLAKNDSSRETKEASQKEIRTSSEKFQGLQSISLLGWICTKPRYVEANHEELMAIMQAGQEKIRGQSGKIEGQPIQVEGRPGRNGGLGCLRRKAVQNGYHGSIGQSNKVRGRSGV
jgi:hypothetical protein